MKTNDEHTHTHEHIGETEHVHVHYLINDAEHEHVHADPDEAAHNSTHSHGHHHDPAEKKRQINRLNRIIGHLQHIRKMIEADEDCSAVLMQISATRSALNGLGKEIINEHITHCITHAVEDGDTEAIEEFKKAIKKYL